MDLVPPQGRPLVIGIELTKQLRRARGWVTLGVMGTMPLVLAVVIGTTRRSIPERLGNYGSVVTGTTGLSLPLIALSVMMLFLLPLSVAIFAGEPVAGEAAWGSLRYLLARPVSRRRVLASKATVAAGFSIAAVVVTVLSASVAGVLAFGWHPLTVVDLQHTTAFTVAAATFTPLAALGRILLTVVFLLCTLSSTFAFSLFLSTLTSRPFSAVAGGVGLSLFSRALDNVPGLHALSPWLPVTDSGTTLWTGFFTAPTQWAGVAHLLVVQVIYSLVFLAAAFLRFTRSDILT
jgi:ABC-2 type transport system permease protein